MSNIRPIALYLPQYHPVPENDEWWGKGFTEWTNVVKAKPLFKGHYQPHLPADLGFCDLRVPEVREEQARLAKENGIYGFCYYHYWFSGKQILERPLQEVFESGKPDFPFMMCWANENWTRRWDGRIDDILLKQNHSDEDDRVHIKSLLPYFRDQRYIKINGKAVFAIYKSALLPDYKKTISIWREEALKEGIELYLCRFEGLSNYDQTSKEMAFDAGIDFQPFSRKFDEYIQKVQLKVRHDNLIKRLLIKLYTLTKQPNLINKINSQLKNSSRKRLDYNGFVDHIINAYQFPTDYVLYPGATPSWDNTARMGDKALYLINSTPEKFKEWLSFLDKNFEPYSNDENFIFINAWNEWAEGCHLEPCQKWGSAYLRAVKDVFLKSKETIK